MVGKGDSGQRRYGFVIALVVVVLLLTLLFFIPPSWKLAADELFMKWREQIVFLTLAIGLVAMFVGVLWVVLSKHLQPSSFEQRKDLIALIAQILGGMTLFITLFSTWQGVRDNETKIEESRITAERNLEIATQTLKETRYRQTAERYLKATEQLGSQEGKIRTGAIYGLGQIANDSDELYWSVIEVLTAYIVENARLQKVGRPADQMPADIQAVFNVLGWRKRTWGKGETRRLELHGTDLRGLILKDKEDIPDGGAHLEGAQLWNANLEGETTNLRKIHLEHAILTGANLKGAYLSEAYLEGADLNKADIEGTDLSFAKELKPRQVVGAYNYECAKYDPDFQKKLEDYLKEGKEDSEAFAAYLKRKESCKKIKNGSGK